MSGYDGKTIAEIVHDYAVVRGDLSEQYARDQLVQIIEDRARKRDRRAISLGYEAGWDGHVAYMAVGEPGRRDEQMNESSSQAEHPGSTRLSAPTTEEQDRINAATVIRRFANRGNRHPSTRTQMLRAADMLVRERSEPAEVVRDNSDVVPVAVTASPVRTWTTNIRCTCPTPASEADR